MSEERLKQLRLGSAKEITVFPDLSDLSDIDVKRFNNGRRYFQDNIAMCVLAMLGSLVAGFSVVNLLDPLVFTNKSNTSKKSLKRYLDTVRHVTLWHYDDLLNPNSSARKSLKKVYDMHSHVNKSMIKEGINGRHFTQYDMSLVQSGFVGFIIMFPRKIGLEDSKTNLEDFVYFWRWIGFFLGIDDDNNICINGYEDASDISKQIMNEIVYPSLLNPPKDFDIMARAFTDGLSLVVNFTLFTPESLIGFMLDLADKKRIYKVSFLDECRILFWKVIVLLVRRSSWFKGIGNRLVQSLTVQKNFVF